MNKRQQKREEERKILAEMDEAMKERAKNAETGTENPDKPPENTPVIHCKRCKTAMEKGVCPTCGFRIYVPMDDKIRKKIRWIVTGACLIAFVIVYFAFIK